MKITRFEAFIEKSVPYFIIGLLLVILLVMGSCDDISKKLEAQRANERSSAWTIIEKGGCEYIVSANDFNEGIPPVHHANCKNHKPCE